MLHHIPNDITASSVYSITKYTSAPFESQDNIVNIATRLRAGQSRIQIPAQAREFLFFIIPDLLSGTFNLSSMETWFFPEG